jgi:hypothetical protein
MSTAEEIVDLIRSQKWKNGGVHSIDRLEAIALVEQYGSSVASTEPDGLANLKAILNDQPFMNSALSVHEIETILANEGGFMPDEAVIWFRASRVNLSPAIESFFSHEKSDAT